MKIFRLLAVAIAAAFFVVPAQAQTSGTVTNHAFAIGKGAGQTGFTSLLCAATELAVGQDAANPACKELSGDITMDADGVTTIGANKVTNGMLRQSGALSLIGRSANSTGNVADISAVAGSGCAYREASNVIGCGELATAALGANIVTNAKLAQMANGTTKCRTTSGTGNAEDCSASQMRSLLSLVVGTNVQAWDTDLDCYAALSGTGIIRRTGSGTCSNGTAVANSELATMANGTIKGNVSGSSATPSDITPSQALDVIGTTRGSILYRGASGWALLTPGTSGQVLTSNGAGADPNYQDASGGGSGYADTDRRNALLTLIYQSKLFASYRRVINTFAAGFKSSDAVNAGSSSNYTVDTANGLVKPSVSNDPKIGPVVLDVNDTASWGVMTLRVAVDSSVVSTGTGSYALKFEAPSGQSFTINKVYIGIKASSGDAYDFASTPTQVTFNGGSASVAMTAGQTVTSDPVSFSIATGQGVVVAMYVSSSGHIRAKSVQSGFSLYYTNGDDAATQNATGYSNYTATRNVAVFKELDLISTGNMTLVTAAQTSDASVSNGRVLLEFDNAATPTLNTDLTAEVTCDGGSNWASAALSAVTSNSQAGRKVAESDDTSCTAGTSFAARIKTLNNKNVPIYGASVTAR